jgi:hypothetical protein
MNNLYDVYFIKMSTSTSNPELKCINLDEEVDEEEEYQEADDEDNEEFFDEGGKYTYEEGDSEEDDSEEDQMFYSTLLNPGTGKNPPLPFIQPPQIKHLSLPVIPTSFSYVSKISPSIAKIPQIDFKDIETIPIPTLKKLKVFSFDGLKTKARILSVSPYKIKLALCVSRENFKTTAPFISTSGFVSVIDVSIEDIEIKVTKKEFNDICNSIVWIEVYDIIHFGLHANLFFDSKYTQPCNEFLLGN